MKTLILYYTETGNTLLMAESLKCDALIDIVKLNEGSETLPDDIERLGIITKTYNGALPYPVRKFINDSLKERDDSDIQYVFSLTASSDDTHFNGMLLENELKESGLNLSYFREIKNINKLPGIEKELENEEIRLPKFSLFLRTKIKISRRKNNPGPSDLKIGDGCTLCGICTRVCPMSNIKIENSRVEIGNDCISCLSCLSLCPEGCITASKDVKHIIPPLPMEKLFRRNQTPPETK